MPPMIYFYEYITPPGYKLTIQITFGKRRFLSMLEKVGSVSEI